MDFVLDLLATVSRWSRSNLSEIALALVGCLLVLFGSDIKGWLEQRISGITGACASRSSPCSAPSAAAQH